MVTPNPLTPAERNALGTATGAATGITTALRILQNFQRSEAISEDASARAESLFATLRDQQGARSSTALGNAAFAQAQRLVVFARTREDLAVAQRLLELAQQQAAATPPPSPTGGPIPPTARSTSVPTWVWVTGGLVVVTVSVAGGVYLARRQMLPLQPSPQPQAPARTRPKAPARRSGGSRPRAAGS